jgi:carbon monoxide dehydrogenase subunit G
MSLIRSGRRAAAILIAACAASQSMPPAAAQEISIEAGREGDFITFTASAELKVDQRIAWQVLSDYDHLAEFIPDMQSSRIVLRTSDGAMVEQKGEFSFLFFHQPIDVVLAVYEEPQRRIIARAVAGNLRDMEGRYELLASGRGVRLSYSGRFTPDFYVPPLIGMPIVRSSMAKRFRAMIAEIVRRDALARGKRGS